MQVDDSPLSRRPCHFMSGLYLRHVERDINCIFLEQKQPYLPKLYFYLRRSALQVVRQAAARCMENANRPIAASSRQQT